MVSPPHEQAERNITPRRPVQRWFGSGLGTDVRGAIKFEYLLLAGLVALGVIVGLSRLSSSKHGAFETIACQLLGWVQGASSAGCGAAVAAGSQAQTGFLPQDGSPSIRQVQGPAPGVAGGRAALGLEQAGKNSGSPFIDDAAFQVAALGDDWKALALAATAGLAGATVPGQSVLPVPSGPYRVPVPAGIPASQSPVGIGKLSGLGVLGWAVAVSLVPTNGEHGGSFVDPRTEVVFSFTESQPGVTLAYPDNPGTEEWDPRRYDARPVEVPPGVLLTEDGQDIRVLYIADGYFEGTKTRGWPWAQRKEEWVESPEPLVVGYGIASPDGRLMRVPAYEPPERSLFAEGLHAGAPLLLGPAASLVVDALGPKVAFIDWGQVADDRERYNPDLASYPVPFDEVVPGLRPEGTELAEWLQREGMSVTEDPLEGIPGGFTATDPAMAQLMIFLHSVAEEELSLLVDRAESVPLSEVDRENAAPSSEDLLTADSARDQLAHRLAELGAEVSQALNGSRAREDFATRLALGVLAPPSRWHDWEDIPDQQVGQPRPTINERLKERIREVQEKAESSAAGLTDVERAVLVLIGARGVHTIADLLLPAVENQRARLFTVREIADFIGVNPGTIQSEIRMTLSRLAESRGVEVGLLGFAPLSVHPDSVVSNANTDAGNSLGGALPAGPPRASEDPYAELAAERFLLDLGVDSVSFSEFWDVEPAPQGNHFGVFRGKRLFVKRYLPEKRTHVAEVLSLYKELNDAGVTDRYVTAVYFPNGDLGIATPRRDGPVTDSGFDVAWLSDYFEYQQVSLTTGEIDFMMERAFGHLSGHVTSAHILDFEQKLRRLFAAGYYPEDAEWIFNPDETVTMIDIDELPEFGRTQHFDDHAAFVKILRWVAKRGEQPGLTWSVYQEGLPEADRLDLITDALVEQRSRIVEFKMQGVPAVFSQHIAGLDGRPSTGHFVGRYAGQDVRVRPSRNADPAPQGALHTVVFPDGSVGHAVGAETPLNWTERFLRLTGWL